MGKIKLLSVCFLGLFSCQYIYPFGLENIGFNILLQNIWFCWAIQLRSSSLQEITVCDQILLDTTEFYLVLYMYVHLCVYVVGGWGVCD